MDPALVSQLAHLDRALVALIEERARLVAVLSRDPDAALPPPAVDDLLRRRAGSIAASDVHALFREIDGACRRAAAAPGERAP